ncbi:MAG: UvrD-helicase domain-containing protein [Anaerolineales bacterium]
MAHLSINQISPTENQQAVLESFDKTLFLEGPAGSGKTTTALFYLHSLLEQGVPPEKILILVPQRTLATPYYNLLREPYLPASVAISIVTISGLAQRMIDLFWPLIAQNAGFAHPNHPPIFLTLETAQYYMTRIVDPLIEHEGYFESVNLDRNRLCSQILDNLNKSAAVGIPLIEIGERLKKAWGGKPSQLVVYDQMQDCAIRFRRFCLQNNLLDFSLQISIFCNYLWSSFLCRQFLLNRFQFLIYDNIEEDVPVAHDLIRDWLPHFRNALLIYDTDGGYRSFLGADPEEGHTLQSVCQETMYLDQTLITSPELRIFNEVLVQSIQRRSLIIHPSIRECLTSRYHRYIPEMIEDVCQQVNRLITEGGVSPGEIVIVAPYISDALRFLLINRMEQLQIPVRSHRPSRNLRDEPATQCLLTWAKLAHPHWNMPVTRLDVRNALVQSIAGLDLTRAELLSQIVHRPGKQTRELGSFDLIKPDMQQRITYFVGERYEHLRRWITNYQSNNNSQSEDNSCLEVFLSRLFGEVLSHPGFGFYRNFDAAKTCTELIESVQKFRRVVSNTHDNSQHSIAVEYLRMIEKGVLAAQYLQSWQEINEETVLIAPAYTYLMLNRPVQYQFWLDIGSLGWWERLNQPLTHPYVLSRRWDENDVWDDVHEQQTSQTAMIRLVSGLIHRCQKGIFLYILGVNEQGNEQRGQLLLAIQSILRHLPPNEEV